MDSIKQPAMMLSIVNTIATAAIVSYGYQKAKGYNEDISKLKLDVDILNKKSAEVNILSEKFNALVDNVKSIDASSKIKTRAVTKMTGSLANLEDDMDELKSIVEQIVKVMKSNNMEVKIQPPEEPQSLFRQKKSAPQQKSRSKIRFDSQEDDEEDMTELDPDDEIDAQVRTTKRR